MLDVPLHALVLSPLPFQAGEFSLSLTGSNVVVAAEALGTAQMAAPMSAANNRLQTCRRAMGITMIYRQHDLRSEDEPSPISNDAPGTTARSREPVVRRFVDAF
jgi:hypothetical protein